MKLEKHIQKQINQMTLRPAASAAAINAVETFAGTSLPNQYKAFLSYSDGAEGPTGEQGHLVLLSADEVISLNQESHFFEDMPGFLRIGGDGGNVIYGIDTRCGNPELMRFVETDLIGGSTWDTLFHECSSFHELIQYVAEYSPG